MKKKYNMLVSKEWLSQFIDFPAPISGKEIAAKLTASTVEVEKIIETGASLDNIVVGKVLKVEPHPNADRLKVCEVDISEIRHQTSEIRNSIQVVCGGSNVKEGMVVAVGLPGAWVKWHGEGEPVQLSETKIRGVESFGMICAADEIGLGDKFPKKDEKEILDLTEIEAKTKIGQPLSEALGVGEGVFDIDNKSLTNRPDLMGHYGMAREVAALFGATLKPYASTKVRAEKKKTQIEIKIEDANRCRRYMAVAMEGVVVAPSPEWLQARLRSVDIRPINNIVDITNYVMMELGQPMHAFDAKKITKNNEQNSIVVRNAKIGELITTLDGKERELTENILVIADSEKPVAIAGVMGGEYTGVQNETTTIIFEAANFDAAAIRKASAELGLRTDASARFEKSLDPEACALALERAVAMVLEMCPGAAVSCNVADVYPAPYEKKTIVLSLQFLEKKLGFHIQQEKTVDILKRLGFIVKSKKDLLTVSVPSWRATKDVAIPEDLVEEVARVYGYNSISSILPSFPILPPPRHKLIALGHAIRAALSGGFGYTEVANYSFLSPEFLRRVGVDDRTHLELENPVAKDRPLIRRSLLPGLLQNLEENARRFERVALFEIGKTYRIEEKGEDMGEDSGLSLPKQDTMLGLIFVEKNEDAPFSSVSEAVAYLLFACRKHKAKFEKLSAGTLFHSGRTAAVMVNDVQVGIVGELHPDVRHNLGVESRAAMAEINLSSLLSLLEGQAAYQAANPYPSVVRDLAFFVNKDVPHADIVQLLESAHPLVTDVELFDVFMGKGVPNGQKSVAYHITYESKAGTLSASQAEEAHTQVLHKLRARYEIKVRT